MSNYLDPCDDSQKSKLASNLINSFSFILFFSHMYPQKRKIALTFISIYPLVLQQ